MVRAIRLLASIALIAYPAFVWLGLSRLGQDSSPRIIALILLAIVAPAALLKLRSRGESGPALTGLAAVPLVTVAILVGAALLNTAGWMLAVPVAINTILLIGFGSTLRSHSIPMIERFARLQEPELTDEQLEWCRLWTKIWCGFFVVNGGVALALACFAPLQWWALYSGLISYGLIGLLLLTEWLLRRRRFPTPRRQAEGT